MFQMAPSYTKWLVLQVNISFRAAPFILIMLIALNIRYVSMIHDNTDAEKVALIST